MLLNSTLETGFKGPIFPVHPNDDNVQGLKGYKSLDEVTETPDLAVIVLPSRLVVETLEACGRKGIRQAIVVSGGFREVGGEGVEAERQLAEVAKKYGIAVLGPNCLGVANARAGICTTPAPMEGGPGFIGLASQSGSFIVQMYNYLGRNKLGFSTAFSVGNQMNVDLVDCMEYLAACPHTRVIALYVEGINRGEEFIRVARQITPHKPIVALYVGGSETGRRAAFSHTGSMSGPDHVYEAVFRQSGVIRAASITEMFDACWLLGSLPQPRGNRVAVVSHSGGPGASAADTCGREGLELPSFSDSTLERLAPYIPSTGNANNPVDLTFTRDIRDLFEKIPQILMEDERVDMLLIYNFMPVSMMKSRMNAMGLTDEQIRELMAKMETSTREILRKLREDYDKPIVAFSFRNLDEAMNRIFIESGIPMFSSPERAARAMRILVQYYANRGRLQ